MSYSKVMNTAFKAVLYTIILYFNQALAADYSTFTTKGTINIVDEAIFKTAASAPFNYQKNSSLLKKGQKIVSTRRIKILNGTRYEFFVFIKDNQCESGWIESSSLLQKTNDSALAVKIHNMCASYFDQNNSSLEKHQYNPIYITLASIITPLIIGFIWLLKPEKIRAKSEYAVFISLTDLGFEDFYSKAGYQLRRNFSINIQNNTPTKIKWIRYEAVVKFESTEDATYYGTRIVDGNSVTTSYERDITNTGLIKYSYLVEDIIFNGNGNEFTVHNFIILNNQKLKNNCQSITLYRYFGELSNGDKFNEQISEVVDFDERGLYNTSRFRFKTLNIISSALGMIGLCIMLYGYLRH